MRRKLLSILALLCMTMTGAWAQYESYWPDFYGDNYEDTNPLVAAIIIDGEIITSDDPRWEALEVAFFVGDECRGNMNYLDNSYVEGWGDPFPVLDGAPIFYDTEGETVSIKMYDHLNGILYDECTVLLEEEPLTILTGEDHMEGWYDPEKPIFLCFTAPADPESTYSIALAEGTEDAENWEFNPEEGTVDALYAGTEVVLNYSGEKTVKSVTARGFEPTTEIGLTPDETGTVWTLDEMPAADIEVEVEYEEEEVPTGIGSVKAGNEKGETFNLNGQRLNSKPAQKGIYIIDGKMVVIK